MSQKVVTEIVEFKLIPGVSDEKFVKTIAALEDNFHSKQSGFIDTELTKGKDGQWVMIQHWQTMEEVREVIKRMMKEPSTEEFRRKIDPKSVTMLLLEQVETWGQSR